MGSCAQPAAIHLPSKCLSVEYHAAFSSLAAVCEMGPHALHVIPGKLHVLELADDHMAVSTANLRNTFLFGSHTYINPPCFLKEDQGKTKSTCIENTAKGSACCADCDDCDHFGAVLCGNTQNP